ncbi:hypothetical protein CERZMDRAFT_42226 [Cercospora zeae-maydis SCOH1-5]|uniref:NTF2-like domain-containing protein n=1 Tax=Cercospora zeae-maydis SCOH1-5 TaxID=717836 RepID=A0A6A6FEQ8_9PEZI|nr:hypothetical protein CERZMDRAFT_42226 [Cercospora zeae-maydis SCOH1-5]
MRGPVLALFGLLAFAFADKPAAKAQECNGSSGQPCLDDAAAQKVAENFRSLISNYSNETAVAVLSPNFTDYSDGLATLMNKGCPNGAKVLGEPSVTSREQYQAGQSSQPNIPFNIKNVWHNCNTVIMRWQSPEAANAVQPVQLVTGLIVMEVCKGDGQEPWIIDTAYAEFNSGAWLYDLGIFKPQC